jgi:hypothetical protein
VVTDDTDRGIRCSPGRGTAGTCCTCRTPAGTRTGGCTTSTWRRWQRRDLTPFDGIQARIIATSKRHRDEVLVGMNRDNPQLHDVYRLDLVTGELVKEIENPGYAGWLADEELVVRGALAPLPDGGFDLLVRDSADGDWRTLLTIPAEDAPSQRRAVVQRRRAVAAGDQLGRVGHRQAGPGRPGHRRDRGAGEDPEADVAGSRCTRTPGAADRHLLKDRMSTVLDPSVEADLKAIRALHPGDPQPAGATTPTPPG